MTEPEIHTWWPRLTAASKHLLDDLGDRPLPERVRDEIGLITGHSVPPDRCLSDGDRDFIRTQGEAVD
ncbi:MAG: hypothetical protein WA971_13630 [Microbacterium sp.]